MKANDVNDLCYDTLPVTECAEKKVNSYRNDEIKDKQVITITPKLLWLPTASFACDLLVISNLAGWLFPAPAQSFANGAHEDGHLANIYRRA